MIERETSNTFHLASKYEPAGDQPAAIAGMSITDERKKSFDFSDPYFDSGLQLAVKKGNDKIKSYDDLKGKTVAAKVGTESANFLEKNKEKYDYIINDCIRFTVF